MQLAANEHAVVDRVAKALYVAGAWRDAESGRTFAVEDPSTGDALCEVADASPADAMAALDAASAAQDEWAHHPPRARSELLRDAYDLIIERQDDLALLMTLEMGKPLRESRSEILYAAEFFRWFSEEAVRISGSYALAPNGESRLLVSRRPVGPALLITPWNFPMAMITRKVGPAIAAGCSMVIKPAEQTPLSALAVTSILEEVGVPRGVVNVVTTSTPAETMAPLFADSRLRKLSFTGSTEVGKALLASAASGVLRVSMELGGNAPFIVFEDADLDAAVDGAVVAKMRNMGQACTAANRFYVARPVADEFAAALSKRLTAMRVGRGSDEASDVGPLIDHDGRAKVATLVEDALKRGATAVSGASELEGPGYFYEPTVLADVPPSAALFREEIFGPVAPIAAFDREEEAISAANDTQHGLVAYVYTQDLSRALRVTERLETGMVGLNQGIVSNPAAPFGGVKQSGLGREGGVDGIHEFLEIQYVATPAS